MTDRHECLWTGSLCQSGTIEDGEKVPAVTAAPDTICDGCVRIVDRTVGDCPEMWVSLEMAIGDRSRRGGERVSGTPVPPANINVRVEDVQGRLVESLVLCAARVSEVLGVDDPQPHSRANVEQARMIEACTRLLQPHVDKLLASPSDAVLAWRKTGESKTFVDKSGINLAEDLVKTYRDGRRELGQTQPRFRLALACPSCEAPTLYRRIDKTDMGVRDEVSCDTCRVSWPHERYLQLVNIFISDEQQRQEQDDMINQELKDRAEVAEWLLAEREWQLSLALQCGDMSAAQFAEEVCGVKAA